MSTNLLLSLPRSKQVIRASVYNRIGTLRIGSLRSQGPLVITEKGNDDGSMGPASCLLAIDCFAMLTMTTRHHDERSEEVIHVTCVILTRYGLLRGCSQGRVLYYPSPHGVYRQI